MVWSARAMLVQPYSLVEVRFEGLREDRRSFGLRLRHATAVGRKLRSSSGRIMQYQLANTFRRKGAVIFAALLAGSLAALAADITFPVTLDPNIPNAYVLATYRHACGGCIPDASDEETYLTGSTTAQIGDLGLVRLASGPGRRGLLGFDTRSGGCRFRRLPRWSWRSH